MYLKDRLYVALVEILLTVLIFLFIMLGLNFFIALLLIIVVLISGRIYIILQIEKYQKENHDNLERIANNSENKNK